MMNAKMGRLGISPRMALGAFIIKHPENFDNRGIIATIRENGYMRFFVGLKEFSTKAIFDPSLFVEIRKRILADTFDQLKVEWLSTWQKSHCFYFHVFACIYQ